MHLQHLLSMKRHRVIIDSKTRVDSCPIKSKSILKIRPTAWSDHGSREWRHVTSRCSLFTKEGGGRRGACENEEEHAQHFSIREQQLTSTSQLPSISCPSSAS